MWDIGGQESLRQAWSTYYTGTHFLLLVVDSTDRERLSIAKEELYKMLGHEVRARMALKVIKFVYPTFTVGGCVVCLGGMLPFRLFILRCVMSALLQCGVVCIQ